MEFVVFGENTKTKVFWLLRCPERTESQIPGSVLLGWYCDGGFGLRLWVPFHQNPLPLQHEPKTGNHWPHVWLLARWFGCSVLRISKK